MFIEGEFVSDGLNSRAANHRDLRASLVRRPPNGTMDIKLVLDPDHPISLFYPPRPNITAITPTRSRPIWTDSESGGPSLSYTQTPISLN
jgi:hypothetical protein